MLEQNLQPVPPRFVSSQTRSRPSRCEDWLVREDTNHGTGIKMVSNLKIQVANFYTHLAALKGGMCPLEGTRGVSHSIYKVCVNLVYKNANLNFGSPI